MPISESAAVAGNADGVCGSTHLDGLSVEAEDWQANDQALADGSRLLSAYNTLKGVKLWIITEAENDNGQRAATTLLLPDEY